MTTIRFRDMFKSSARAKRVIKAVGKWRDGGARVPDGKSPFGDGRSADRIVDILRDGGYS